MHYTSTANALTQRIKRALFAICLLLTAGCQVPDAQDWERLDTSRAPQVEPWADNLRYGTDSPNQLLDLYTPTAKGNGGLVLFIHGGGWVVGSEDNPPPIAMHWLAQGWLVASLRYRLGGEAPWPAQRDDVHLATAWLRESTGADTIILLGHSAGGHIATAAGTTPSNLPGSRPDGVVAMSAPFDPLTFAKTTSLPPGTMNLVMHLTFGCPPDDWNDCDTPQLNDATLPNGADPTDPPMYIAAGDLDTTVPWTNNQAAVATDIEEAIGTRHVWIDLVDTGPTAWRQHELDGAINLRHLTNWMNSLLAPTTPE